MSLDRPDSPCIGVCTTLYDVECKGCGRTYMEVAEWNGLDDEAKDVIWARIESEGTAWRFSGRYNDRK